MLIDDKPDLDDALLVHVGIKGMKWGVRKARTNEGERKTLFTSKQKKIAAGVGVAIAGAAAAIFILANRGKQPLPSVEHLVALNRKRPEKNSGVALIKKTFATDPTSPAPFLRSIGPKNAPSMSVYQQRLKIAGLDHPGAMQIRAGQAAHEQALARVGNQKLTDKTWRDSAKMAQMARDTNKQVDEIIKRTDAKMPSIEEIRRHLADPNHVWEI